MVANIINEKLFAFALLMDEGFDLWKQYSDMLDKLFLENPNFEVYLELESINDVNETVNYLMNKMNYEMVDIEIFGNELLKLIRPIFMNSDIHEFGRHMYSIWGKLPRNIQKIEPFGKLCFADDPLSYGDIEKSKQLYEEILRFYEKQMN